MTLCLTVPRTEQGLAQELADYIKNVTDILGNMTGIPVIPSFHLHSRAC